MSRWFRLDDDVINDPKILLLPEATRWIWIAFLCIASKNDGTLPKIEIIALSLRVKAVRAAEYLTVLVMAGLIDKTETGYVPHNWNKRQFKSDGSTERVKRFRERERNVSSAVSETGPHTHTERDRIGSAGASNFTEGSKALASAFWQALGFNSPIDVPPEFAGIDWRAVSWETAGWTPDLIATEARKVGPDKPLTYHEKVFATAFAKRQAPLPTVEIRESEKLTVTHGKPRSAIIQAADDLCRTIAGFDGPQRGPDELRGDQGEASTRLLSHG